MKWIETKDTENPILNLPADELYYSKVNEPFEPSLYTAFDRGPAAVKLLLSYAKLDPETLYFITDGIILGKLDRPWQGYDLDIWINRKFLMDLELREYKEYAEAKKDQK